MKVYCYKAALLLGLCLVLPGYPVQGAEASVSITVGSKSFTESVILGEIFAHLARQTGIEASHQPELY